MTRTMVVSMAVSCVMAAELHVSPSGNDNNPGSVSKPVRTPAAAQKLARGVKGPVTVFLHGGTYYLAEPLVFAAKDSGSKKVPTVWQAYKDEQPVFSGGSRLALKWEPYKNGIYKASVPAGFGTDQLFVNGERQILARYPNYNAAERIFNGYAPDAISPGHAKKWANPAGGFMHAMHVGQWGGFSYEITGKDDAGNVQYKGGWQGNRASAPHEKLRMVEGIFEELDAPGEWFLDTKSATLYYCPPAHVDLKTAVVEGVRLAHLVEFRGTPAAPVRHVQMKGITFRHAARTFMQTREPLLRSDWTIYRGGAVLVDGAEDCTVEDGHFDQVGGNAVFVNNYNRRVAVRGCRIERAGAGGVMFVGDPKAVRSPLFEYGQRQPLDKIDRTPGPQSDNYPADCVVEDCLITQIGRFEKQATGVGMNMAARITVRHCSIYDMPRAGINIGDGCWGGHVIEFCDVFDTVKETGDHGSFNSWGRDRFWLPSIGEVTELVGKNPDMPLLDMVEPNTIRNSRWRCDHGWDIDLDDGSSNYRIYNNLCLNGGIKNREGYVRVVENNIMVGNSFHPHVWYANSDDVFRRNIICTAYKPISVGTPWGKEVDFNLLHAPGRTAAEPARELQEQSGRDAHSVVADALFVAPAAGDYRVRKGSPALKLGFKNFAMDKFGVQKPALRALVRTPRLPGVGAEAATQASTRSTNSVTWRGATVKNVVGLGEVSAAGLAREAGVRVVEVPAGSQAARVGLKANDVILTCSGKQTDAVEDLKKASGATKSMSLGVWRNQQINTIGE